MSFECRSCGHFQRANGLARYHSDIASAGPLEVPTAASLPSAAPSTCPVSKPELNDYVCLNLVQDDTLKVDDQATHAKPEQWPPEHATAANKPVGAPQKGEGINTRVEDDQDRADGNENAEDEAERIWRGSAIRTKSDRATSKLTSDRRDGENASPECQQPLQGGGSVSENDARTADGDDDDDKSKLYTRTLGSSVSVIDEKEAVTRNGGARFVGEDPIRGRLRAADPFLWMGRLHAGAAAISILIDTAKSTLLGLNDSSTSATTSAPNSIASDQSTQGESLSAAGATTPSIALRGLTRDICH